MKIQPRFKKLATSGVQSVRPGLFISAVVLALCSVPLYAADDLQPGLVGQYYQFKVGLSDFPVVAEGQKPILVRVDKQVNVHEGGFASTRLTENFYARWDGVLKIDKPGRYEFATNSDDGSRLFLDDKLVVDNGGPHSMGKKSGTADLMAGEHTLKLEYFQGDADAGCELLWTQPGGSEQAVPGSALLHKKGAEKIEWDEAAWKKLKHSNVSDPNRPWNKMDYGQFLSASIYASQSPEDIVTKGVAVKLDKEGKTNVLFDTMMMRYAVGWTGGYLQLHGVAYDGAHGTNPSIDGDLKFHTSPGPGWAGPDGNFTDPRDSKKDPYGPMPKDFVHYKGIYQSGDKVAFMYTVGSTEVLDAPFAAESPEHGSNPFFIRTIRVSPHEKTLTLRVCDVEKLASDVIFKDSTPDAHSKVIARDLCVTTGVEEVTAVHAQNLPADADLDLQKRSIVLTLPPDNEAAIFNVGVWSGPKSEAPAALHVFASSPIDPITLTKGGPAHWPDVLSTKGTIGAFDPKHDKDPNAQAYVVDTITVPQTNPFNSWLRFSGFDFFPDGHSAALCSWSGDVWIVSGIDDKLQNLKWKRFATGLFQPLGLKIVDGDVFVHGRDQITHLHDLNGDGEADFYENFNNDETVAPAFHEFAFDLQRDAAGNFYIIKAGPVNPGGRGFTRPITANQGTLMRISPDGSKLETIADGFRAPNGMCVRADGQVVTGDNQGSWTPVDRLNWIKPGGFYGVVDLAHRTPEPTVTDNPLCWFIYPSWDNSNGDPCFVTSDKWGPFKDELIYGSYGKCSLFKVLKEEAGGEMQGGVVKFPLRFLTSVMRLRFNDGPTGDGQLYTCGLRGWQTDASGETAFQRIRYTGKPVYLPTELHVKENGVEITYLQKLDPDTANDAGNFSAEQWNYLWTSDYGTPEVKASDGSKKGRDPVTIKSAKLLPDGKTVFLEIPEIKPVMQMLIKYNIDAADGAKVKGEIANTINFVPPDRHLKVSVGKAEVSR